MQSSIIISNELAHYKENELIFASNLYKTKLNNKISQVAFYKTLERMCKSGKLVKIAKGTYHLPKVSKYGIVPPSENEIVSSFINNGRGTIIGYSLYNSFNLTTQISKNIEIMSSTLDNFTKKIRNIIIHKVQIDFTSDVTNLINGMEVLQNYYNIQDLNYNAFLIFTKKLSEQYNEEVFNKVISTINYKKSTIAFLREILNYYGKPNNLDLYLSGLSEYKHPKMEDIYEIARTSRSV